MAPSKGQNVKIVLLGAGAVGKSALSLQIIHRVFVEVYDRESVLRTAGLAGEPISDHRGLGGRECLRRPCAERRGSTIK
jgi:GTPase SAR1 family protein